MKKGITIALAGNPNCGKTTLFNALTGSNQYVGNWPGVTVEKKEGKLKKEFRGTTSEPITIADLPGIYSLSSYTLDEVVARDYLLDETPDVILNIIDATNLERNLYLTTQLMEIGIPVVIALNMMDVVKKTGDKIDTEVLSAELGCKIVEICALKGQGIGDAAQVALREAASGKAAARRKYSGPVEHAIAHIEDSVLKNIQEDKQHWYAIKIFERDEKIMEKLHIDGTVKADIEKEILATENELDDDAESIITNERYIYIAELIAMSYKRKSSEKLTVSDKIDKIVTNRWLALPIFILIMTFVYYVSITTIGTMATDWVNDTLVAKWIQPAVGTALENAGASAWVISLVVDGIIGGLGAPLGFIPQMAVVFLCLSFLEDCGYMARVAFIMDRIFRRFGLSGKSFISFMIGSGCGVPGIMACRTIENEKDRRMTMITTTAIPCGAKLPVIALISGFLMGGAWWMAPSMYFLGISVVIMSCIIMKKMSLFAGDPAPFVMELPQYHIPAAKSLLLHIWERVWAFIKKAGTILFVCCAVMWFLASFGFEGGNFGLVDTENSLIASMGNAIAFIFIPLGFGSWQAVASAISGFVAKEGIVSTMGVLAGVGAVEEYSANMQEAFAAFFPTGIAAVAFLIFNLFDSPCLAAISTLAKEMGSRKFFWFAIAFQNVMSYCLTLMIYQLVGLAIGAVSFNAFTVVAIIILAIFLYLLFRPDPAKKASHKLEKANQAA